jgi:anaerobic selenocysteine-containing dehydrogenase
MTKETDKKSVPRRDFLKLAGLGSVVGAAAVAGNGRQADAASQKVDRVSSGYRETEHVRKYYELSRF